MKIYYAPLEGITGHVYRNVFHRHFSGVDAFYAPFISPGQEKKMTPRQRRDICPENNTGICLVPQILTNKSECFLRASAELFQMGYQEVNLNLGCPSGTVVAKNKGAGALRDTEALNRFLYEIFEKAEADISVKTRIGITDESEFEELLPIFNQYKMKELIIHPRVQKDMYQNKPRMDVFRQAVEESTNPLCYNGDITTKVEYRKFCKEYPSVQRVMIGRGLLANPGLVQEIVGGTPASKEQLRLFHDDLYFAYQEVMSGERNVLFKMKELWLYLHRSFTNGEQYMKKIKKVQHLSEYEVIVKRIFATEACENETKNCG